VNYYGPGKTFLNALYCYTIRNLLGWYWSKLGGDLQMTCWVAMLMTWRQTGANLLLVSGAHSSLSVSFHLQIYLLGHKGLSRMFPILAEHQNNISPLWVIQYIVDSRWSIHTLHSDKRLVRRLCYRYLWPS
jgi:hypothetical protein